VVGWPIDDAERCARTAWPDLAGATAAFWAPRMYHG